MGNTYTFTGNLPEQHWPVRLHAESERDCDLPDLWRTMTIAVSGTYEVGRCVQGLHAAGTELLPRQVRRRHSRHG